METTLATGFAGKTALITGAGRGIGRAIALGLADAGAGLILLARSAGQLEETRTVLLDRGAEAARIRVVAADLGDQEQRGRAAGAALEAAGVGPEQYAGTGPDTHRPHTTAVGATYALGSISGTRPGRDAQSAHIPACQQPEPMATISAACSTSGK